MRNFSIRRTTAIAGCPVLPALPVYFGVLWASLFGADAEFFLPHVINGGGTLGGQFTRLQTIIEVLNLSDQSIVVKATLTTDDGEPFNAFLTSSFHGSFINEQTLAVNPGQLGHFFTSSFGDITAGWGKIRASGAVGIQVNLSRQVFLPGKSSYGLASRASYPPPELSVQFGTFQEFDFGSGENDVGLAILNPSETEAAEVRVALIGLNGSREVERNLTIPPRRKIARFLKSDLLAGNPGIFRCVSVTSTIPVSALPVSVGGDSWTAGPLLTPRPAPDGAQ